MSTSIQTSRGTVLVRYAGPQDAARLRALRLEALSTHPEAFSQDYQEAAAKTEEAWTRRLLVDPRQSDEVICVAATGDDLVGMAGLYRFKSEKTKHAGNVWGVYVKPEFRNLHIAEQLIRLCLAWAKEQGLLVAEIGAIADNAAAIRCYLRCGFRVFGVEPQALLWDGIMHDELLMSVNL